MKQEYYGYLLDTNICIYYLNAWQKRKRQCSHQEKHVFDVIETLREEKDFYMSGATWGELVFGAEKSQNRIKNLARFDALKAFIPVLIVDREVWEFFAEIKAALQKKGKSMDDMDIVVAATAKRYNLVLVTDDADMNNLDFLTDIVFARENWALENHKPSKRA